MIKDVIELAREAGMNPNADKDAINALGSSVPLSWLDHFAALVAAQTKEQCAQYMESCGRHGHAAAIRALNTEGEGNDRP